jgi:hypothetical protein
MTCVNMRILGSLLVIVSLVFGGGVAYRLQAGEAHAQFGMTLVDQAPPTKSSCAARKSLRIQLPRRESNGRAVNLSTRGHNYRDGAETPTSSLPASARN